MTQERNHTRNEISASAESGIDKDVKRDITEGQGGGMQGQRRIKGKGERKQGLRGPKGCRRERKGSIEWGKEWGGELYPWGRCN